MAMTKSEREAALAAEKVALKGRIAAARAALGDPEVRARLAAVPHLFSRSLTRLDYATWLLSRHSVHDQSLGAQIVERSTSPRPDRR